MEFRLFGFDVEIKFGFWITTVILGLRGSFELDAASIRGLAIWVPVVLVSVLAHELGHALAIRRLGLQASITLHWMGGLTAWREILPVSRLNRIGISLAGPFAGFLVGGLVYGLFEVLALQNVHFPLWAVQLRASLLWVNLGWGLINLVPVLPFDGGTVVEQALGPKRQQWAHIISAVAGLALAVYFMSLKSLWGTYLFGRAALESFMKINRGAPAAAPAKADTSEASSAVVRAHLLRAKAALDRDDTEEAIAIARDIRSGKLGDGPPPPAAVLEALHLIGWAHVVRGEMREAEHTVGEIRMRGRVDPALVGNVALASGRLSEARAILEKALSEGDGRKEVFGPLIQILLRQDDVVKATEVALAHFETLSSDDARQLAVMAKSGRAPDAAARLYEAVMIREKSGNDGLDAARAYAEAGLFAKTQELVEKSVGLGIDFARAKADPSIAKAYASSTSTSDVPPRSTETPEEPA